MPKKINIDLIDRIGRPKDLVDNLLNSQVEQVEARLGGEFKGIGDKILSFFVKNGHRLQLSAADVSRQLQFRIDEDTLCQILDQLTEAGLLRFAGDNRYEITNNVLAQRANQKVEGTNLRIRRMELMVRNRIERDVLLDEDDLNYLENYLYLLELTEPERAFVQKSKDAIRRKRRFRLFLIIAAFSVLSLLTAWALWNQSEAVKYSEQLSNSLDDLQEETERKDSINEALEIARDSLRVQRDQALDNELRALTSAEEAKAAQRDSYLAQLRAQQAAEQARVEKGRADVLRIRAESLSKEAQDAAEKARQSEILAQEAAQEAENARARAEAFNKIVISRNVATRSIQNENPRSQAIIALHAYQINEELPEVGNTSHPAIIKALYTACQNFDDTLDFSITEIHVGAIRDIKYHPTRDVFYSASSDGNIWEWKVNSWPAVGKPSVTIEPFFGSDVGAVQNHMALNTDGSQLLVGGELPLMQLFNTNDRQSVTIFPTSTSAEVFQCGFLGGDQYIGFGADSLFIGQENAATTILAKQMSKTNAVIFYDNNYYPVSYRTNATQIPEGYEIRRQLFNGSNFEEESIEFPGESLLTLSVVEHFQLPDGNLLIAFGFEDGRLMILKTRFEDFSPVDDKFSRKQHLAPISDFAFSKNGKFLAAASYDGTVSVWELEKYMDPSYLPMVFDQHNGWAMSVAFSNAEDRLIVGDQEGNLTFWNLDPAAYANLLCDIINSKTNNRDYKLSEAEWQTYFGSAVDQDPLCIN